jgi:hypothetical protein
MTSTMYRSRRTAMAVLMGHTWTNFAQLGNTGVAAVGSPAAATLSNGDMEIAYTGVKGFVYHGWWARNFNFNNWTGVVGGQR